MKEMNLLKLSFSTCQTLEGFLFLGYAHMIHHPHSQLSDLCQKCQEGTFCWPESGCGWYKGFAFGLEYRFLSNNMVPQSVWVLKSKGGHGRIYLNCFYYIPIDEVIVGTWLYSIFCNSLISLGNQMLIYWYIPQRRLTTLTKKQTNKITLPK